MTVISVIALKGGVGKTVTTINLAVNLSRRGYRVLVADADPQGNTTGFFGAAPTVGMYELLTEEWSDPSELIQKPDKYGVDIISADLGLFGLDAAKLMGEGSSDAGALVDFFATSAVCDCYDVALIDCPPGFTAASIAAIAASDHLIVPVTIDKFSFDGWQTLHGQIEEVSRRCGNFPSVHPLFTMMDNSEACKQVAPVFRERVPSTLDTEIRHSDKVPEGVLFGQALCEWSPYSKPAKNYQSLTDELVREFGIERGGAENG